jgi:DNA primase
MASPEIEEIKARLNVVDVIGQYVELRRAGRNWNARCPFHKERTPSFMVSPERGTYICFGCGEKGDIFSFIEKMEGIDFRAALTQLADKAGVTLSKLPVKAPEVKAQEEQFKDRLMACCQEALQFFETELAKRADVLGYIRNRSVSDTTRHIWRVGYAPAAWSSLCAHLLSKGFVHEEITGAGLGITSEKKRGELYDRFRGRIMFPIFDTAGRAIAFSGRHFEDMPESRKEASPPRDTPAKYVNSPETVLFKKSRVLYGLHAAKETIRKVDCALLVEGQFDLLLAHQSGLRFAVAVSGTALTPEHLTILSRYTKRLVLGLDNDAAGLRSGLKSAAMALGSGFDVKIPRLPDDCKDPADAAAKDPELLRAAVRESRTAIEFFLDALRKSAKDERAYKKLVESAVLPLIAALPSRIEAAHFVAIVANRLQVPEDAVRAEVATAARKNLSSYGSAADAVSETPARSEQVSLTRLEKAVGMILMRPDVPAAARSALAELLGAGRTQEIEKKVTPQAEEFRFLFEELGDESEAIESLMETIRQEKLDEDIATTRSALRVAQTAGDPEREAELLKNIQALAKQKHALKK